MSTENKAPRVKRRDLTSPPPLTNPSPLTALMSRVEVGREGRGATPEFLAGARHRSDRQGAILLCK